VARTGDRIGTYEIVRLIARGEGAAVYEAYEPELDRLVALKELDLPSSDPAQVERFIDDLRASAGLDHPNIVTGLDCFESGGVPYIAREYLPRGSLRPWVGRLSPAQIFGIVESILAALAYAEKRDVTHGDLKPENVLITRAGEIKIADFGVGRAYRAASGAIPESGIVIGTPTYMAPEQAMAQPIGPYTDLYALGVMTHEMYSGTPPFQGESAISVIYKHVSEPPPALTGVDPRLTAWVAWLLEKDPKARPAGAPEAWHELEPTIVDLLGPYWRDDARLPEIMEDGVERAQNPEPAWEPEPAPAPAPAPEPDVVSVAAGPEELERVLELTRSFLLRAQERVHRSVAPRLAEQVSGWLPRITPWRGQ